MKYNSLLHQLYRVQLFHPVKNGLENMKTLSKLVHCDLNGIPVVHVAGTNGKGTVCLKIAESLRHAGYRAGLYTSPHVSSFRERVQINGSLITEDDVVEGLESVFSTCEAHAVPATFFEITTALAFRHFARQAVDIAVIEVGLGGRLDATNIVHPTLSVITSIQLDHMKILGDSIEAIAIEKAGIIKPHSPVLISDACPTAQLQAIASSRGSPSYLVRDVLKTESNSGIHTSLPVDTDRSSADIARAALFLLGKHHQLRVPTSAMQAGLAATLPCRFQEIVFSCSNTSVTCVLDIAHNTAAMESLVRRVKHKYPNSRYRVVFGMSADKDVIRCAEIVKTLVDDTARVHCVAAKHSRALSVTDLQILFDNTRIPQELSIDASLRVAVTAAAASTRAGKDEIVIVCGSVFIMSEARKALGICEPCDDIGFDTKYYMNNELKHDIV